VLVCKLRKRPSQRRPATSGINGGVGLLPRTREQTSAPSGKFSRELGKTAKWTGCPFRGRPGAMRPKFAGSSAEGRPPANTHFSFWFDGIQRGPSQPACRPWKNGNTVLSGDGTRFQTKRGEGVLFPQEYDTTGAAVRFQKTAFPQSNPGGNPPWLRGGNNRQGFHLVVPQAAGPSTTKKERGGRNRAFAKAHGAFWSGGTPRGGRGGFAPGDYQRQDSPHVFARGNLFFEDGSAGREREGVSFGRWRGRGRAECEAAKNRFR